MTDAQPTQRDRFTLWFILAIVACGIVYVACQWTPSSYGVTLNLLLGGDGGPIAGTSREIRSDEWAISTPLFQAAVRNHFQRINETSFYRDDMRSFYAVPLKDWSLIFKPQLWAFFVFPPAVALSTYYAILMCTFLSGFHLLFRHLGVPAGLAAATSVAVYFTGFTQFWWTTYGPLQAGLPWILLLVLSPMPWWKKALWCAWAFPAFVISQLYPVLLITFIWCALFLIAAVRPSLFRAWGEILGIAVGAVATVIVVLVYFHDLIPIMSNTVYPGHRTAPPGTVPFPITLSQLFPFLTFRLSDFQVLTGENICEIGTVGSFIPLLALCLVRYRALWNEKAVRRALLIVLAGLAAFTLWEIAPVPLWIGRLLYLNTGGAQRWFFCTGLLLTFAALLIWKSNLISMHPLRIALFALIGPVGGVAIKIAWLIYKGTGVDLAVSMCEEDLIVSGLAILVCAIACYLPVPARSPVLWIAVALINAYGFGRFNPIQPAGPIFHVPESAKLEELRKRAAESPGGLLLDSRFPGSTLNGIGFRSVSHVLMAPQLPLIHSYFPAMAPEQFNQFFNRFEHLHLLDIALPVLPRPDVVEVPIEVFVPIRNVRTLTTGALAAGVCSLPSGGSIDRMEEKDNAVTITGWAPWSAETQAQGIRVLSARVLRGESLLTITRADIGELRQDYRFVKAGFAVRVSSVDGKALRAGDVALVATGTSLGDVRLACCGCP